MKQRFRSAISSWLEAGRKIGFFLLLVAGSAAIGFVIAWPLWLFATARSEAYTIFALCLAAAGIAAAIVRAAVRKRRATKDPGRPGRAALSVTLAVVIGVLAVAGLYMDAVFLYRRLWALAAITLVLWAVLAWLLSLARRALRPRKSRPIPAENSSE